MVSPQTAERQEAIEFDGLSIRFDRRVLRPRPWTAAQSRWAASLLGGLPAGRVLELCSGAGQIGLAAVATSTRRLVCVDADPVAAEFAVANAERAGLADRVEVRAIPMTLAVGAEESFALVIADPPWVRRADTSRYPEDPLSAIDGGSDGLDVARLCLEMIGVCLIADGAALLQLGSTEQVSRLQSDVELAGLAAAEVREYDGGAVVRLVR